MHAVNIPEHSKGLCWKHLESTAQNPCEPLLKSLLLVGVDHDRFPCEPSHLGWLGAGKDVPRDMLWGLDLEMHTLP